MTFLNITYDKTNKNKIRLIKNINGKYIKTK